ncbi:conserved hypothetical protein [Leishmania major strain Friedlin]|uniref:Uncharacterized protein n=1 Tax=Leishmania major TaxID=5664 RepID=Q4Q476_LEIMA|nr:conserved hypothetical protein [Leishmania major strain Friedlin]CAG9580689.1 hypothetical_protein_-_conserved [Leishmania major strain Friedlin]CAJ06232.1 conserved hypothetical protein [Leishmania major strain Friedlin]|eukprot:XP_001685872.1 conserved hypothetical protein [Leishmania major strain Friedlin]
MVVAANPAVGAAPAVTGATCAVNSDGWCSNSTLKFEGTDLASVKAIRIGSTAAEEKQITCADKFAATADTVSCTVAMASSAKAGLYPVTLVLGDQTQVEAGSVLLGALWELPSMQTWTSTTASAPHKVTGQSSDWPSTGDAWSISGTFDPANHYSVLFYNIEAEAAAGNPSQITCALLTVTASKLTCTIVAANGVMGMYRFLVKDTTKGTLLLGSTSLGAIAVNPPLPAVTGAQGECATNSAACVNGAALTISGTNFNYRDHAYQQFFVGVTEAQRSAIRLTPTAVSMTDLTANLAVAHGTPAGSYPVFVKVQVCMMHMMSPPRYVGNLVLQSGSIAGFNMEMPTGYSSETQGAAGGRCGVMSAGYIAVTILAVVFGVMFLILLVALTLVCLRKAERHRHLPEGNRFWDVMASDVPAVASERKDFDSDCVVR